MKQKVVAVVPMKLNNRRLPSKNTKCFTNGEPLCAYILQTLLKINEIDEIYVYCSNDKIKEYIPSGVIYRKRGIGLDTDETSMNEVLKAFSKDVGADIYVMTHTTAPFVRPESIRKGLKMVLEEGYDSAFAVEKIQDFLWKNGKPLNYNLEQIPRTQDLDLIYKETSGFYIYKADVISKWNRRIGNNPAFIEVGPVESIDIDELEDFQIADAVFQYNKKYLKYQTKEGAGAFEKDRMV